MVLVDLSPSRIGYKLVHWGMGATAGNWQEQQRRARWSVSLRFPHRTILFILVLAFFDLLTLMMTRVEQVGASRE